MTGRSRNSGSQNSNSNRGKGSHSGEKSTKSASTRGGSSEQHREAGRQSHKND